MKRFLSILIAFLMCVVPSVTSILPVMATEPTLEYTVTFQDKNGGEVGQVQIVPGTTMSTAVGMLADAAALETTAKTEVFAGWETADGTLYTKETEINGDITVKAIYSKAHISTAVDMWNAKKDGRLTYNGTVSLDRNSDGVVRFKLTPTQHPSYTTEASHKIEWSYINSDRSALDINEFPYIAVKAEQDASSGSGAWIQYYSGTAYTGSTSARSNATEYTHVWKTSELSWPNEIYGYKYAPWSGSQVARLGTYVEIEYIAALEKQSATQYIDVRQIDIELDFDYTNDYKIYTAADIANQNGITYTLGTKTESSSVTENGEIKYFRINPTQDDTLTTTNKEHYLITVKPDALNGEYDTVFIGYKVNPSLGETPQYSGTTINAVLNLGGNTAYINKDYKQGSVPVITKDGNVHNAMIYDYASDLSAKSWTDVLIYPYGYATSTNVNVPFDSIRLATDQFDIAYIGFAKDKASAEAFIYYDYYENIILPSQRTVIVEGAESALSGKYSIGDTVELAIAPEQDGKYMIDYVDTETGMFIERPYVVTNDASLRLEKKKITTVFSSHDGTLSMLVKGTSGDITTNTDKTYQKFTANGTAAGKEVGFSVDFSEKNTNLTYGNYPVMQYQYNMFIDSVKSSSSVEVRHDWNVNNNAFAGFSAWGNLNNTPGNILLKPNSSNEIETWNSWTGKFAADWGDGKELKYMHIRPWTNRVAGTHKAVTAGDFFALKYVAFFANEAQAEIFDYGEYVSSVEYTITVTATEGGKVQNESCEPTDEYTVTVPAGDPISIKAIPDTNYKLRNWYDITNGNNIALQKPDSDISQETDLIITYTPEKDMTINANFMPVDVELPSRLIAFIDGNNANGKIQADGKDCVFFDDYTTPSSPVILTAISNPGYTAAYWTRVTQDASNVTVLVGIGDEIKGYPLGGEVFYIPVFIEENSTIILYVNEGTNEILGSGDTAPVAPIRNGWTCTGWTTESPVNGVTVKYPIYTKDEAGSENLLEVIGVDGKNAASSEDPAYGEGFKITSTNGVAAPVWTITTLGTDTSTDYVIGIGQTLDFNYMFAPNTKIVITESDNANVTAPFIHSLASWNENDGTAYYTRFTGAFVLPTDATLVDHGVMLSKEKIKLDAYQNTDADEINTPTGVIMGRISDNTTNATSLYTITKKLDNSTDKWYGRAYLIYKDTNGGYHTVFGNTIPNS